MPCFHPKTITPRDKNGKKLKERTVPCWHCSGCQAARTNELITAIQIEFACHPENVFGTLTFNDQSLPLEKEDLRLTLRNAFRRLPTRIIANGERGPRGTHRAHFHFCEFGRPFNGAEQFWKQRWHWGHIRILPANKGAAAYIAKHFRPEYTNKDVLQFHPDNLGVMPLYYPRKPCIGGTWLPHIANTYRTSKPHIEWLKTFHDVQPTIRLDGKTVALPRRLKVPLRKMLGLPSQSDNRDLIQQIRIDDALADEAFANNRQRKLEAQEQRQDHLRAKARAIAFDKDPGLKIAEAACRKAIAEGEYTPIAIRRQQTRMMNRLLEHWAQDDQ